ncbi:hypothetical protein NF212_10905 [Parasalinivibrio latis]
MFSQSLTAQLVRWLLLLGVTLFAVHYCEPLQQALSKHAVNGGCHQQNSGIKTHGK